MRRMRVSRRFLSPFANGPMTRLRNLTRTDCDTNFGTKFGEQNVKGMPDGEQAKILHLAYASDQDGGSVLASPTCSTGSGGSAE